MLKRRRLSPGQQVVIIYDTNIGYVQEKADFIEYRRIIYGNVEHEIPVFKYKDKEITGLECFWILSEDADPEQIEKTQRELISTQVKALELGQLLNYQVPNKIKDHEINKMAEENTERMEAVIKKFGFDPRDETWLEKELAEGEREKNWFKFERENGLVFSENWDDIVAVFNQQFKDDLSPEIAKNMSKKRMRYWLGAHHTRMSGNSNKNDWKKVARQFEEAHRNRENRMLTWTLLHKEKFPLVRTKKPLSFWAGPYFNECIEKIPNIFTTPECRYIKEGIVLRVISYDPEQKYIRLDFTPDIRKMIKTDEVTAKPWEKDKADYDMWLKPEEIETHLEMLEEL